VRGSRCAERERRTRRARFSLDNRWGRFNTLGMAQVGLEHLTKIFTGPGDERICAVEDACLVANDRELLALVGPSGCGKTTTLRLIAGLEEPTTGTISINGEIVNRLPPKDRDVAMVFQHHALYPHMSVYDNMGYGLKLRHVPRAEIDQRVQDAAQVLGLTACLGRKPAAISGGERQRVALGRALVRRPKVFLLDEPLSNLDVQTRVQMRTEIARLHARLGSTMIYVTHDQVEALTLGHRVAVMKAGVIQQVAAPMELYQHPANVFVAGFIGSPSMNLFEGTVSQRGPALVFQGEKPEGAALAKPITVFLDDGSVRSLGGCVGKRVILGIRPEHVICGAPTPGAPPVCPVEEVVELVQHLGAESYLHLAGHARGCVVRVRAGEQFSVGQRVRLGFDVSQAHFFDAATGLAVV
jgi:multiple sugar transport system ATP-binding protein